MATVKDVLDRARSQLGVSESPPGSNRTPYGEWYGIVGPWCAMFVSWCFYFEGLPLADGGGKGFAYTPSGAAWFQRRGKWTRTPAPGHVVFFDWPNDGVNRISHVGIVESVRADGTVVTIEGNTSDKVMRRNRRVGIVGYGVPSYADGDGGWFEMATTADLERVVRKVLNEGTAYGQRNWAGTSQATLRSVQHVINLLTQQVIPKLPGAQTAGMVAQSAGLADSSDVDRTTEEVTPAEVLTALEELSRKLSPAQAKALGSLLAAGSGRQGHEEQMT
jgi:surface antigen